MLRIIAGNQCFSTVDNGAANQMCQRQTPSWPWKLELSARLMKIVNTFRESSMQVTNAGFIYLFQRHVERLNVFMVIYVAQNISMDIQHVRTTAHLFGVKY